MSARCINGVWYCDFRFDGARYRRRSPTNSQRGAEKYERKLMKRLRQGLPIDQEIEANPGTPPPAQPPVDTTPAPTGKELPTFAAFAQEFMDTYAKANNKVSVQAEKRSHLNCHLLPAFGELRLDEIDMRRIERFKAKLLNGKRSRKRVNNVLGTLGRILTYATEIELLEKPPRVKRLKVDHRAVCFLDFAPYEQLVDGTSDEPVWNAAILLGGDAGLRLGEIRALQPGDWNRRRTRITVQRSLWLMEESSTKGWKRRTIPLTSRLQAALERIDTQDRAYLVSDHRTQPLTFETTRWNLPRLCQKAGIPPIGWHALRHTFCSHLAMMGAPPRTIQELAGHADLATTLKYMHLVEGEKDRAIDLLERRAEHIDTGRDQGPDHPEEGPDEIP